MERDKHLAIERRDTDGVVARMPANPDLTPPGYYLLFLLRDGIPSVGRFVHLE